MRRFRRLQVVEVWATGWLSHDGGTSWVSLWARVGFVLCRFFVVYRIALPSSGMGDHSGNGCFLTMRVLAGNPANGKGVRRYKLRGYTVRITHVPRPTGAGFCSFTRPLVGMVLQWKPLAECDGSVSLG